MIRCHPIMRHSEGSVRYSRHPWGISRNTGSCRWITQCNVGMVAWISKMVIAKNIWRTAVSHRITPRSRWLLLKWGFPFCCRERQRTVFRDWCALIMFWQSSGNDSSGVPSNCSCSWLSVSANGVGNCNISNSAGEKPGNSPSSPLSLPWWWTSFFVG